MTPIGFPRANSLLGAPKDWVPERDGDCGALPVAVVGPLMISAWRPTADELAILNEGGVVTLQIYGNGHPPVMLGAVTEKALEMRSHAAG